MVSSESLLLLQVAIVLMMHIMSLSAQATQLSCNLDIHYRMYTSGKLVNCVNCRSCGLGFQPDPPCGIIIDKYTSIGNCKPCLNGYFSSKKDAKNCEKCQSESCFPHQVIKGTCTPENDTSKCINKCVTGYQMNANQTKCVRNKPDNGTTERPIKIYPTMKDSATKPPTSNIPTTPSNNPTTTPLSNHPTTSMKSPPTTPSINPTATTPGINSPPPTSTLTPTKMASKPPTHNDSSLSTGVVITIIITIIMIVIIVIMVILVCYLRKTQDARGAGLQCAKPHAGGEDHVCFIKEEECKETGLPSTKMHCPETSGGFESSKHPDAASLSNNSNPNGEIDASPKQHDALIIANGTNMENNSGMPQPLRNRQVVIDMSGKLPITMFLGSLQQPQVLVNNSQQSPQTMVATENHSVPSFENMPYNICKKIYETFDICGGVKSWEDVASWLELGLNDVKRIEITDPNRRTQKVIQTWATKTGNDVPKFESILREKKMTGLADMIKAWMQSKDKDASC